MSKDQARVMKHIAMDAQTGCWLWLGTVRSIKQPYGRMIIGSRTDGTRRSIGEAAITNLPSLPHQRRKRHE